jgi:hypothetical protein
MTSSTVHHHYYKAGRPTLTAFAERNGRADGLDGAIYQGEIVLVTGDGSLGTH